VATRRSEKAPARRGVGVATPDSDHEATALDFLPARPSAAPRLGRRHAVFIDVENTSSEIDLLRVLEDLNIDRATTDLTAVGNWRVVGQGLGRTLAQRGAHLVHSAPAPRVPDWSDLWIAVTAGMWLGRAEPGDALDILSDDRAFDAVGDAAAQARILRKMGGLHWDAGVRARALQCFEAGLALLGDHREHIEQAHLYQEMGRLAFRGGDSQRAVEWAEQARLHAERIAADPALDADGRAEAVTAAAQSHNTLGVAFARLGRLEEAVGHIERSVALARETGLLQAACRGLANLSVLYSTLDPARAIEAAAAGLEMAKKIGDLGFQSRLYTNLAVAYCALTNRCDEQGVGAAHAAIDLDRRLGQLDHLAVPLIVLGQIYQCHGDPTRAIAHYREALALAEEADEPQLLFPCYDGLATVHLDLGDEGQAEEFMQKAQAVCERAGLEPDALVVLPFLD